MAHSEQVVGLFPSLGRDNAAVLVDLGHTAALYADLHGLDLRRTHTLRALFSSTLHYHQQVLMTDIEVFNVSPGLAIRS